MSYINNATTKLLVDLTHLFMCQVIVTCIYLSKTLNQSAIVLFTNKLWRLEHNTVKWEEVTSTRPGPRDMPIS